MVKFTKIFLLVLTLIILWIPAIQKQFKILPDNFPLHGSFSSARDTTLNAKNWFNRIYQEKKENYLNEQFGFRNFLVKLNNQIDFSLYEDINVRYVLKGKKGYLYNTDFFNTFSGRTYKGDRYADSVFNKIQDLNDFLEKRNKKLLVFFAPCKESFYTEFLPDSCLPFLTEKTFYNRYKQKFESSNIPFLDCNSYFKKIKKTAPYPLFTQGALHWTNYGTYFALDTLLKRVRSEIKRNVNQIKIKSCVLSDSAMYGDDDISVAMNLLINVNSEKLAYPSVEYIYNQDTCYKPKVLIIGDSFFFGVNNTWVPVTVFSDESYFLYYYKKAMPFSNKKSDTPIENLDISAELKNTDIVILFFTIGNTTAFPYDATKMLEIK